MAAMLVRHLLLVCEARHAFAAGTSFSVPISVLKQEVVWNLNTWSKAKTIETAVALLEDVPPRTRHERMFYIGPASVGTPPQTFDYLLFDTGVPDLWVPTVNCSQCSHQQLFDNYSSSTFSLLETNDSVLPCNQGEVRGPYAQDVITLDGVAVQKVPMIAVSSDTALLGAMGVDGVLGLWMPGGMLHQKGKTTLKTFLQVLQEKQSKADSGGHMTFFFDLKQREAGQSYLQFGGDLDARYPGGFVWLDVVKAKNVAPHLPATTCWAIEPEGITWGDVKYTPERVIIDAGFSCIARPASVSNRPSKMILHVGGYDYWMDGDDISCSQSSGVSDVWVLGDSFHRRFAVTYDFGETPRIGLPIPDSSWSWKVVVVFLALCCLCGMGGLLVIVVMDSMEMKVERPRGSEPLETSQEPSLRSQQSLASHAPSVASHQPHVSPAPSSTSEQPFAIAAADAPTLSHASTDSGECGLALASPPPLSSHESSQSGEYELGRLDLRRRTSEVAQPDCPDGP